MKKGDIITAATSIKHAGKLLLPGEKITVGDDMPVKLAQRLVFSGAADIHVGEPDDIDYAAVLAAEDLKKFKVSELEAACEFAGIDTSGASRKDDYIALIEGRRESGRSGDAAARAEALGIELVGNETDEEIEEMIASLEAAGE